MIDVHQNATLSESFEGDRSRAGGVRHDPQRVLGKNMEMAHLPLVTIE